MEPEARSIVLRACSVALLPVVRWLLRNHLTYRDLSALIKQLFVRVALEDYGLRGRETNLSRVAILTGLDRKEVRRVRDELRAGDDSDALAAPRPDRLSRVLKAWHEDPQFSDGHGRPLPLQTRSGSPSFADLAKGYAGDVPASAVLKELANSASVRIEDDGTVVALRSFYMPQAVDPQAALRSGEVFYDLGQTIVHNLYRKDSPSRFEGRASNVAIPATKAAAFREFLEDKGQRFLDEVDHWLNQNEAAPGGGETVRLGAGLYAISGDNPGQRHYAQN